MEQIPNNTDSQQARQTEPNRLRPGYFNEYLAHSSARFEGHPGAERLEEPRCPSTSCNNAKDKLMMTRIHLKNYQDMLEGKKEEVTDLLRAFGLLLQQQKKELAIYKQALFDLQDQVGLPRRDPLVERNETGPKAER